MFCYRLCNFPVTFCVTNKCLAVCIQIIRMWQSIQNGINVPFSLFVPGHTNERHKTKLKDSHRRVLAIEYKHCPNRILGLSASIICTNSEILNLIH